MNRLFLLAMIGAVTGLVGTILQTGCTTPDPNAKDSNLALPDRATFPPVALALNARCSSLDCHGSPYRNLRLYGFGGLRLRLGDQPGAPATTGAEFDANFEAITSIEPLVLSEVMKGGGVDITRLTFVRKARNAEAHKGGQRIIPGDNADKCMVSWFRGQLDQTACVNVLKEP